MSRYPLPAAAVSGYSALSPKVPPDHDDDVLSVTTSAGHIAQNAQTLAEQGPCLVPGIVSMDHSSFTTKIKITVALRPPNSAASPSWVRVPPNRSSPATPGRTWCDLARPRLSAKHKPHHDLGAALESRPPQKSTTVRLSIQFLCTCVTTNRPRH